MSSVYRYFNSQPHEEADTVQGADAVIADISTHSLTKRLTTAGRILYHLYRNFNSQPHEEADSIPRLYEMPEEYFNSQPHEEADLMQLICITFFIHFNSQPHEEADDFGRFY